MKLIPITAKSLNVNIKSNYVEYTTDVTAPAGVILQNDSEGIHDMVLIDNVHPGGEVKLKFKPIKIPARRFEVDEKIGVLLVQE